MYVNSLLRKGNNQRILSAFRKGENGKELQLVFLGGSVTEAYNVGLEESFAHIACSYLKRTSPKKDNIKYHNAGIAGTSSLYGMFRLERDVFSYQPDIVIIEFAVNDRKEELYRKAFETLVRKIVQSKSQPAVILLFVKAKEGYTCQSQMRQIGQYYDLTMISIADLLDVAMQRGEIEWKEYSDDLNHPNRQGHQLIAGAFEHYFEEIRGDRCEVEYKIPEETFYEENFSQMTMIEGEQLALVESCQMGASIYCQEIMFKNLFVIHIQNNCFNTASVDVVIDGQYCITLNAFHSTAWGNPVVQQLFEGALAEQHRVELKVSGSNIVSGFTWKEFIPCLGLSI